MYIEFFGLPGSGKSTLARELAAQNTTYEYPCDAPRSYAFFFAMKHPRIAWYWLSRAAREACRQSAGSWVSFLMFKWALLVRTFSEVAYAQRSTKHVILDEGFLQRTLSVFETKITDQEVTQIFSHLPSPDVYVEVTTQQPVFERYRKTSRGRARYGSAYLAQWEALVRENYATIVRALSHGNVPVYTYQREYDTVATLDKRLHE